MIIGCCGAGKSTLARRLHALTNLPLVHLDQHYWQPNWVEPSKAVWTQQVKELVVDNQWIIDGNYSGTMDIRFAKADTIIFMDYPRWTCLGRVLKRIFRHHGKVRPDMPEGCRERFDLPFLQYVFGFKKHKRPAILRQLAALSADKKVIVLKNDQAVNAFLSSHF